MHSIDVFVRGQDCRVVCVEGEHVIWITWNSIDEYVEECGRQLASLGHPGVNLMGSGDLAGISPRKGSIIQI